MVLKVRALAFTVPAEFFQINQPFDSDLAAAEHEEAEWLTGYFFHILFLGDVTRIHSVLCKLST